MKIDLSYLEDDGMEYIVIRFNYHHEIVKKIKLIRRRIWWPLQKYWTVPYKEEYLQELLTSFKYNYTIDFDNKVTELYKVVAPYRSGLDKLRIWMQNQRMSPNTIRSYISILTTFLSFTKKRVDTFTEDDVQFFNERYIIHKKLSSSVQNQFVSAIKLVNTVVRDEEFEFVGLSRPRKERKIPVVYTKEEISSILVSVRNLKHRMILSLVYSCGLRIGEALNLKKSDISFENKEMKIVQAKFKKDRFVTLSPKIITKLDEYYKAYKPLVYVFEGRSGGKYSTRSASQVFKRALLASGVKKGGSLHSLRHSFATHLADRGVDISIIQKLLGHEDIRTTLIYTRISKKRIKEIRSPFEDLEF